MQRKGQMEFAVIVGLIVLVAVVVFLAFQAGILVPPVSPVTGTTQNSVENFIRGAAYYVIGNMSMYGGYMEPAGPSVLYLGEYAPFWHLNGQAIIPDVPSNFVRALSDYLRENKDAFASSLGGKNVTIGEPQVTANILANQIDLTVSMPTAVNGVPIQQPYRVTITTKFGDAYEFSKNFVDFVNLNRPFEYFIMNAMMISEYDGLAQKVPLYVHLTSCGDFVFKTWWDIKPEMEYLIKSVLAHTYMPGKVPLNIMHKTNYPKWPLPPMGSKEYQDINITFDLPDGFELTRSSLQFSPEPISAIAEPIPMVGACNSDPVFVNYYLSFPVVVKVRDPLTGNTLRFAISVYVMDSRPGSWANITSYQGDVQASICSVFACSAKVAVYESGGSPVPYADVSFMGCSLGRTGADGLLEAAAPCGIGSLDVYKSHYGAYSGMKSSDEVADMSVVLDKIPYVNLRFYEVIVNNITAENKYRIFADGVNPVNTFAERPEMVHVVFFKTPEGVSHDMMFNSGAGVINTIPPADYYVSAILLNSETFGTAYGGFATTLGLREDMDGKNLYVYIPYVAGFGSLGANETIQTMVRMTSLLQGCGIGPISETEAQVSACSKGYDPSTGELV